MESKVSNLKDLIIAYICSTGELSYEQFIGSMTLLSEYKKRYLADTLSGLCKDRYVRKYKAENGEVYLRLCFPKGEKRAAEISPELFFHYCLLAGKSENDMKYLSPCSHIEKAPKRFCGGSTREKRRQQTSKIIFRLKEQAVYTDFIKVSLDEESGQFDAATTNCFDTNGAIKPQSIFESDGGRVGKKFFMQLAGGNNPVFIINRALIERSDDHRRSDLTKTIGMLFKKTAAFLVYYVDSSGYRWNVNCEKIMKDIYKKDIVTFPQDKSPGGIFFMDSMNTLADILSVKCGKRGRESSRVRFEPLAAFSKVYMFPVDCDTEALTDILLDEEGEGGFNKKTQKKNYKGETEETARLGNVRFYNLAFLNYEKLLNARRCKDKGIPVAIGVMSWQKDALAGFLGMTEEEEKLVVEMDEEIKQYAKGITGKGYL